MIDEVARKVAFHRRVRGGACSKESTTIANSTLITRKELRGAAQVGMMMQND